jgi:hypothetical protein
VAEARAWLSYAAQQRAEVIQQAVAEQAEAAGSAVGGEMTSGSGGVLAFHPPLTRRLKKLRALGASIAPVEINRKAFAMLRGGSATRLGYFLMPLLVVLWIIVAALMIVALVLMAALSLFFSMILLALVYGLFMVLVPA